MEPNNEPQDTSTPSNDEEIVDPSIPAGNAEQVVIRRHPFGLVALYLQVIFGLLVALGLIFFLLPTLLSGDIKTQAIQWLSVFTIVAFALSAIFLLIATAVYRQNRWVVTDDSITQILQVGLFNRQTAELSMANIEDVSAEQRGIIATALGFGTLKAETAGEKSNFHFLYCPNPNMYAKIILDARERYINSDPGRAQKANPLLDTPRGGV